MSVTSVGGGIQSCPQLPPEFPPLTKISPLVFPLFRITRARCDRHMTTHRAPTPPQPGRTDGGTTAASSAPAACPLASHAFEMVMTPASVHVARARGTTAAVLSQWALPDASAGDAQLVVSELVTNAISHGSGDVRLRVRYDNRQLRIEVTYGSAASARRRHAGANDLGGRGLLLVAHLSRRWGVTDSGRTTYAVVPTLTEAPPCRRTTQPTVNPTC